MFKWFWTVFSLGAPDYIDSSSIKRRLREFLKEVLSLAVLCFGTNFPLRQIFPSHSLHLKEAH